MLGREVKRLIDRQLDAGSYNVHFDVSERSSGVYLYRLIAGERVATRHMLVVR